MDVNVLSVEETHAYIHTYILQPYLSDSHRYFPLLVSTPLVAKIRVVCAAQIIIYNLQDPWKIAEITGNSPHSSRQHILSTM